MVGFLSYLQEDAQGKNLHLEHLEDEILNFGIGGARGAINFLQSLRDMLSGSSRSSVNMTVKWDGAPAIFAGTDPSDGKFFVAKKGVFNKTPLLYKSTQEINKDSKLPQALKPAFTIALQEFSKLGIKGVLQGDLMFTSGSLESETIDGERYTTFQPNTIVYAVPKMSELEQKIKAAKIGVVWHTTYTGNTLESMKASFGVNISGLRKSKNVWMDDASYRDTSGTSTFTKTETAAVTTKLSQCGRIFKKINSAQLGRFLKFQNGFTGKAPERILIGCPRIDFLHPKFDSVNKTKKELLNEFIIPSDKKIITIATAGSSADLSDEDLHKVQENVNTRNSNPPDVFLEASIYRELREMTVKIIEEVAANFPQYHVVLKPHPNEVPKFWVDLVEEKNLKNITIMIFFVGEL